MSLAAETRGAEPGRDAFPRTQSVPLRRGPTDGTTALRVGLGLVLAPVWLAQLLTQAKSFENPLIGNRRLNELGLHTARLRLAHRLAAARRRRLAGLLSAEDRKVLDRDGFIVKPDFLPPEAFAALVEQARSLRGPARELVEGDTITRRIPLGPDVLARLSAARRLVKSDAYRNLLRYAGASSAAPMLYLQSILTRAVEGAPDPQTVMHADTFHPTVKAWLYLNEAANDAVPFVYIPGSHKLTPRRLAWERAMSLSAAVSPDPDTRQGSFRLAASDAALMGLPEPRVLNAPPNTLIVADTFGFHARGRSALASIRVEIWAFGRRNPFLPWLGLDPWSVDALGLRKAALYWRLLDLRERTGLGPQRWRDCGVLSAFDPPAPPPEAESNAGTF